MSESNNQKPGWADIAKYFYNLGAEYLGGDKPDMLKFALVIELCNSAAEMGIPGRHFLYNGEHRLTTMKSVLERKIAALQPNTPESDALTEYLNLVAQSLHTIPHQNETCQTPPVAAD